MRLILWIAALVFASPGFAGETTLTLASTTSTQNSGLYNYLLPIFEAETGIHVNVVAVGTGQALRIARNGDADLLIVHHRASEDAFVAQGYGVQRFDIMYNDFVLVGPRTDPVSVRGSSILGDALTRIAAARPIFVSRGDDSGTHKKERELWAAAGLVPQGGWYREIGAGMGAALNMSAAVDAYTLSDRGTWLSFGNKQDLDLLFSGDEGLRNPYSAIAVNPDRFPHVKAEAATVLIDWLVSPHGQQLIGDFRIQGQQLFCPYAQADTIADAVPQPCPAN